MSDDLTERLREWWDYDHGRLIEQALDRIEELEAKALANKVAIMRLEAKLARVMESIHFAHNSLHEINPSNYDHDDVCTLNDRSVEVIISLSSTIAELKGETDGR